MVLLKYVNIRITAAEFFTLLGSSTYLRQGNYIVTGILFHNM